MTKLCDIAFRYGTDKCPQIKHHFTEYYYRLFKDRRREVRKVIEIGVGYGIDGLSGASLYMWRDFFSNAQIYGADILEEHIFKTDRIETFLCDQTKKEDLLYLLQKTGTDIDLFIDDGLHTTESQLFTFQTVMPLLDKNVTYVIEDAGYIRRLEPLKETYDFQAMRSKRRRYNDDRMIVLRNL